MGRKSVWKNNPRVQIRIPKKFSARLIEIARLMDDGKEIDITVRDGPGQPTAADPSPVCITHADVPLPSVLQPHGEAQGEEQIGAPIAPAIAWGDRDATLDCEANSISAPETHTPSVDAFIAVAPSLERFATELFTAWQALVVTKASQPWGVAVELTKIYELRFSHMLGNHFLKRIEKVIEAEIVVGCGIPTLLPGNFSFTIAGGRVGAITYYLDGQVQQPTANPVPIPPGKGIPPITAFASEPAAPPVLEQPQLWQPQSMRHAMTFTPDATNHLHRAASHPSFRFKVEKLKLGRWFKQWLSRIS